MTPEQKQKLENFLFDDTPLYHKQDIQKVSAWVEDNLLKDHDQILKENEVLKKALIQAEEVIKLWHNTGVVKHKSKEVVEEIWATYYTHAPEMKIIREVLQEK